jgi:hypothetical protein
MNTVIDNASAAVACEFWAQPDGGLRGDDLRNAAKFLRSSSLDIERLRGTQNVMRQLLTEALNVIATIEGECTDECEQLAGLCRRIESAVTTAEKEMTT